MLNGVANISTVEFVYRLPSMSYALEVRYVDGDKVIFTTSLMLDPGTTTVYPATALIPAGYALMDTEPVLVTADESGVTPQVVVFRITAE